MSLLFLNFLGSGNIRWQQGEHRLAVLILLAIWQPGSSWVEEQCSSIPPWVAEANLVEATKSKTRTLTPSLPPWYVQHIYIYSPIKLIGHKARSTSIVHNWSGFSKKQTKGKVIENKIETPAFTLPLSLSCFFLFDQCVWITGMEDSFEWSNLHACLKRQSWQWKKKQKAGEEPGKERQIDKTKVTSDENGLLQPSVAHSDRCKIITAIIAHRAFVFLLKSRYNLV
jgi:hypothetical protein